MKKLYRKGTVHPSPAPPVSDQLAILPATILSLTAALTAEDREVLAYLLSCSAAFDPTSNNPKSNNNGGGAGAQKKTTKGGAIGDHPPMFSCDCFWCYMSFWARWDSSPNRQLIHEIIDAFEDSLIKGTHNKTPKNKREKKKQKGFNHGGSNLDVGNRANVKNDNNNNNNQLGESKDVSGEEAAEDGGEHGGASSSHGGGGCEEGENGSVKKFMSFIGERIWGVWGN